MSVRDEVIRRLEADRDWLRTKFAKSKRAERICDLIDLEILRQRQAVDRISQYYASKTA